MRYGRFSNKEDLNCKITETKYENEIQTEIWNENLHVETGISNWHIWTVVPNKMMVPFFQIAIRLNSLKNFMKQIQIQLWNLNL